MLIDSRGGEIMRKVVLYIAQSLDGYVADANGGVEWLGGDGSDSKNLGGYDDFIKEVDTVILGYKTYDQIVNELSPETWPYTGKKSYVFTRKIIKNQPEIFFTDKDPKDVILELKTEEGKDIWICGGATLADYLLKEGVIDRVHITVIPTILGEGIRLFTGDKKEEKLRLLYTTSYNGMVDLVYEKRE